MRLVYDINMDMKTDQFPFAFFEGKIVPIESAKVSIMTNALQYGSSVFGGMRGYYDNQDNTISLFRIDDHYKRFLSSLKILGVSFPYSQEQLKEITISLLKKNNQKTDTYIRPFAYTGHCGLGPNFANVTFSFSMHMLPLGEYLPVSKGLSVMVSSWRRVNDNAIPARAKISGAYVNSALARKEATDYGFDEAIMLTDQGHVCEGSAENLFIVRDGVLITAPIADEILEGITRRSLLQVAADMGIPTEVRSIDRSELYIADEVFFAGTGVQLAWIAQVDKRTIGTGKRGEISAGLQDTFFRIIKGKEKGYSKWCTKVEMK
jgi:branched-chain amino acid aminotransferase